MNLEILSRRLIRRLDHAEALFVNFAKGVGRNCTHDQVAFLDGLLSYTWQAWGRFCRDLVMHSCLGAVTKAGVAIPACVTPVTVQRVSYIAIRAKRGQSDGTGSNSIWRYEPTWGDVTVLSRIVTLANPGNTAHLLTTFGAVTRGPMHLQRVRNACAHLNDQSFSNVQGIQVYYLAAPIRFPCEASFWLDPMTADFAFVTWLGEMRAVAAAAA